MESNSRDSAVLRKLKSISDAWLSGNVEAIADCVAEDVVMVVPGFVASIRGRDSFVAGFRDFCENAKIVSYEERDHSVQIVGSTAIATFLFDMVYERNGTFHSTGRDFWIFAESGGEWIAVWRTMFDTTDEPVPPR